MAMAKAMRRARGWLRRVQRDVGRNRRCVRACHAKRRGHKDLQRERMARTQQMEYTHIIRAIANENERVYENAAVDEQGTGAE